MGKLEKGEKSARLSKDLATIRTDVPLDEDLANAEIKSLDTPQARKELEALHFHTLLKRLAGGEPASAKSTKKATAGKEEKPAGEQQQLF